MSFAASVEVMKLDKKRGAWEPVPRGNVTLASACGVDAGTCVTVPAHGSLTTVQYVHGCPPTPKTARYAEPGTFAFRVSVCPGSKPLYNHVYGASFTTEPFTVLPGGTVTPGE